MQMTNAQRLVLKAFIAGNGTLNGHFTAGRYQELADALNAAASGPQWVWRTAVTEDEFVQATGVDVANGNAQTVWSWTGAGYITRVQGERDAWVRIFKGGQCNPSLANVRQAFVDILSGVTAPAPANRNHLTVIAKRQATTAENALATGTGTFAAPKSLATFSTDGGVSSYCEGTIQPGDIGGIMA